jgi:hypothetical protein
VPIFLCTQAVDFRKGFDGLKAEFLIAERHGRMNARAELNAGRTSSARGLQFMPALDGRSVSIAGCCLSIELPANDRWWDIGMKRRPRVAFGQLGPSTIGAEHRERDIVGFVDLLRNASTMVLAVILAALASRLLQIGLAFLAKGGGLAFAFRARLFRVVPAARRSAPATAR